MVSQHLLDDYLVALADTVAATIVTGDDDLLTADLEPPAISHRQTLDRLELGRPAEDPHDMIPVTDRCTGSGRPAPSVRVLSNLPLGQGSVEEGSQELHTLLELGF